MPNAMIIPAATLEARVRSTQTFPAVKVPAPITEEQISACEAKMADKALRDQKTVRPGRRSR